MNRDEIFLAHLQVALHNLNEALRILQDRRASETETKELLGAFCRVQAEIVKLQCGRRAV